MKSFIIFFLVLIVSVETRRVFPSNYMKNMHNSINFICNKEAFIATNNIELYNCLNSNNVVECKQMNNYNEYMNINNTCIKKYNTEFLYGILISVVIWISIGFINI